MPRPRVPLISRRTASAAALHIIDTEGLAGLSMRRLAAELGAQVASLYHHFTNKEDVLVAATELAFADLTTPTRRNEQWRTWLPRNSRRYRDAILRHPELVPVVVRRIELGVGAQRLESSARRLVEEGVPLKAVIPLIHAVEMLAIGSAVYHAREDASYTAILGEDSVLGQAEKVRSLSCDEIFDVASAAIAEAIEKAAAAAEPSTRSVTHSRTHKRRPRADLPLAQ